MEMAMVILAIADDRRNMLRVHRRHLRDTTDPFQIPEARFIELFRFNKEITMILLNEISPYMKNGIRKTFIPKSIRLVAALHFYATGSYQRDIGQDFVCPISKTMASRIIKDISYIIQDKLMDKNVRFPTTLEEQNVLQQRFFSCTGFPGVIGAIDCTHDKIKKPSVNVEYCYRNRKGYFSKNVQLICDYDLKILGCFARFGGSIHDAFIWENIRIRQFLENQYRQNNIACWLIGDSGYPLQPWLMTPIRNPENSSQRRFNFYHARARNCVERLNGVLKKVFACLSHDRGLLVDPAFSGVIINACCTLHNFRRLHNMGFLDMGVDLRSETEDNTDTSNTENISLLNQGRGIRDNIVRNYFGN